MTQLHEFLLHDFFYLFTNPLRMNLLKVFTQHDVLLNVLVFSHAVMLHVIYIYFFLKIANQHDYYVYDSTRVFRIVPLLILCFVLMFFMIYLYHMNDWLPTRIAPVITIDPAITTYSSFFFYISSQ